MEVLVTSMSTGNYRKCEINSMLPRIGERFYLGFSPVPKIIDIIWFPPKEIISKVRDAEDTEILIFTE